MSFGRRAAKGLYPPVGPFETSDLPVSDGHVLYVERCGRPGGAPVVFLHGGAGLGLRRGSAAAV